MELSLLLHSCGLGQCVASLYVAPDVILLGPTQSVIFSHELGCKESSCQILRKHAPSLWEKYLYWSAHSGQPCTERSPSEGDYPETPCRQVNGCTFYKVTAGCPRECRWGVSTFTSALLPHTCPTPTRFLFLSADTGVLLQFFNFNRKLSVPF